MSPKFQSPLLNQLTERLSQLPTDPNPQRSAVLVAITNEAHPKILYTLRAADMSHHAGEVSFAGGKREVDDTTNASIALREAWEETGIAPEQVTLIGELPLQYARSGMAVLPVVGIIPSDVVITPERGEIARVFWGDLADIIAQPTVDYHLDYPQASPSHRIISPSFVVDGETVWGLTGRITAILLEIGFGREIGWDYRVNPL